MVATEADVLCGEVAAHPAAPYPTTVKIPFRAPSQAQGLTSKPTTDLPSPGHAYMTTGNTEGEEAYTILSRGDLCLPFTVSSSSPTVKNKTTSNLGVPFSTPLKNKTADV